MFVVGLKKYFNTSVPHLLLFQTLEQMGAPSPMKRKHAMPLYDQFQWNPFFSVREGRYSFPQLLFPPRRFKVFSKPHHGPYITNSILTNKPKNRNFKSVTQKKFLFANFSLFASFLTVTYWDLNRNTLNSYETIDVRPELRFYCPIIVSWNSIVKKKSCNSRGFNAFQEEMSLYEFLLWRF